jgi:hypothetical protein
VVPCLLVLPMGAVPDVMLAQACLRRLTFLSNSGRLLFRSGPCRLAPGAGPLHASYIDDPVTLGVSEEEVNDANDAVGSVCENVGLPTEASRRRRALGEREVQRRLGFAFEGTAR